MATKTAKSKAWKEPDFNWNRTAKEIASEAGCTIYTAYRWASEVGQKVKRAPTGTQKVDWDSVEWTHDGKPRSFDEIAAEVGCTRQAVYLAAKKYGIENPMWVKRKV